MVFARGAERVAGPHLRRSIGWHEWRHGEGLIFLPSPFFVFLSE